MHNEDVEKISEASIHSRQYYVKKMCFFPIDNIHVYSSPQKHQNSFTANLVEISVFYNRIVWVLNKEGVLLAKILQNLVFNFYVKERDREREKEVGL